MKEARLQTLVPTNRNWIQRLDRSDKVAHHTDVPRVETIKYLSGRSRGYWGKEYALTCGGLGLYELQSEKSAEVIVATGQRVLKNREVSPSSAGLNIELCPNSVRNAAIGGIAYL